MNDFPLLAFELHHGRATKDEDMDELGVAGPIFIIESMHSVYADTLWLDRDGGKMLCFDEGLLYYDGTYYGDYFVFMIKDELEYELYQDRIEAYDEQKSDEQAG